MNDPCIYYSGMFQHGDFIELHLASHASLVFSTILVVKHTTASLILCENWDKEVRADMTMVMDKIVPEVSLELLLELSVLA